MSILRKAATAFLCVAFLASTASAGITPPNAKARVFGVGQGAIGLKIPGIDKPSNGLPNVAKGTKVYLYCGGAPSKATAPDAAGTWFKSAAFTMYEKPSGSASDLTVLDSIRVSFVPDMEGTYRISMVGTDDMGRTGGDTIVVNVAKYVGVGGIVGNAAVPECSVCHSGIYDTWKLTNHATAMQRKLDDPTGHFGPNCLSCHNTGSTDPNAQGDGFMALLKTAAWVFPTALKAGNFDSLKLVSPELAKLASIQCENCHGPGSAHMGVKADNKIVSTVSSENCIQCHDAPTHHVKVAEWRVSAHANSMTEGVIPEYMNRGSTTNWTSDCARCHTSNGYIDVFVKNADPSTAYSKAPYKDAGFVGCATCHDPHSNKYDFQLRKEVGKICEDCHIVRLSSHGMHPSHQGSMLKGIDGKEFPGYDYPDGAHTSIPEQCVACHMAAPVDAKYQGKLGAHTFRVVYDNDTPDDDTDDVLNTTGCATCHGSQMSMKEVEDTQAEFKALLAELANLLPKSTSGTVKNPTDTTMTQLQRDCSFNYYFVNNDGSFGVHNNKYAKALLESSIAELKKLTAVQVAPNAMTYELGQNYPNPFNPSTTLSFSVPQAGNVRIAIYDGSGKEINVLVNGYYTPGTYRVMWNGLDNNTQLVPSGVYFYRIAAGNFTATRKMVFMK